MRLLILPGDGIGPEITRPVAPLVELVNNRFGTKVRIETHPVGLAAFDVHGTTLPDPTFIACREADGVVLGPLSTSEYRDLGAGGVNASARLRLDLDLYANIRPCRGLGPASPPNMDLVIVRENTEGFYAVRTMYAGSGEFAPDAGTAFALRKITQAASRRIALRAFDLASRRRGKVTAVHKANVLALTDGVFLAACREVRQQFPDVSYEEELVDASAAHLVKQPSDYDVLVTTNLFGDILSNEAAQIAGSLGLAGSLNHGESHGVAQAAHGSAPDIAGRDIANPVSMLASVGLLLDWMSGRAGDAGLADAARELDEAIRQEIGAGGLPADMGGRCGTREIQDRILSRIGGRRTDRSQEG